ncbi:hypothetical protein KQI63_06120 [bacterium]|nr:hypothetical protein [bacterium]
MGRSILTFLVAFVAAMVIVFVLQIAATIAFLGPEAMKISESGEMPDLDMGLLTLFMVIDLMAGAFAGWITAKMARDDKKRHVFIMMAIFFLVRIVYAVTTKDHPVPAFNYISAVLMMPAIWFGGWLVLRGKSGTPEVMAEAPAPSPSPIEAPVTPEETAQVSDGTPPEEK